MEIVSEPELRFICAIGLAFLDPEKEAGIYVRSFQSFLRAMGSSDGNMEEVRYTSFLQNILHFLYIGPFRCDVSISVNRKGGVLGTHCEIKNLNSVKFMMAAISCDLFS